MSVKRTRKKKQTEETSEGASAIEAAASDSVIDADGGETASHDETFAGDEVERLEAELDALDAENPGGETDAEEPEGFDVDPAGGLEAADDDSEDMEDNAGGNEESDDEANDDEESDDEDDRELTVFDADAEDREEELARRAAELKAASRNANEDDEIAPGGGPRELSEMMAICEALIFVSDEPLTAKAIADVLNEERGWVQVAIEGLAKEFNERNGGMTLREVAGGWQIATRPEHHEHIRTYLKSKPSAKLSLAALETLAVIAYKQPVTVPEILEIRGVQSSSAIKTLLDKRLIIARGRKEVVGRPMMYGTSKEFLLQFGLRDLSELPSIEDFEDLAAGES